MSAPSAAVLSARDIDFSWPRRSVFRRWSGDFAAGLTWLRGVNGSGKSTLLQILAGAVEPQAGRLRVDGIDAAVDPVGYRREVFFCGPGGVAFDHLRPTEFFGFMRSLYPRFDVTALADQVRGFALEPHLDRPLAALSTGTQRKVWVSAALVAGSAAVLLDEPTAGLDRAALDHLQRELARRATGSTTAWIVTSHEALGPASDLAIVMDLPPPSAFP